MNKTFDIKRFGKVLRYDAMSYFRNFGWTLLILFAIPIGIWFILYTNINEIGGIMGGNRYGILWVLMIIEMILAPSRLYKTCNDSRRGMQFAMLPASSLEKFLSMLLYCAVVTPILYLAGAIVIDTILALIPGNNPYDGFVFKYITCQELIQVGSDEMTRYVNDIKLPLYGLFAWLAYVSIFIFTNMVFKKRKVSKTIGILALIGIVVMIIIVRVMMNYEGTFALDTEEEFSEHIKYLVRCVVHGIYVFNILLSSLMLYLTYYKIRTQKY